MSNLGFDLDNDYFANEKFFNPTAQETVKVWVESENDINFWSKILPENSRWIFEVQTTELIANDNKMGTGCDRIKSLVASNSITLGKNSIACIDSDYHRGLGWLIKNDLESLQSQPYWFYTVLHSIENVFYTPKNILDTLCSCFRIHSSKLDKKFLDTLNKISTAIYYPLLISLSNFNFIHNNEKTLSANLNEINEILSRISSPLEAKDFKSLEEYHEFVLNHTIWENIDQDISLLNNKLIIDHVSLYYFKKTITKIQKFGINESNIYLFFRGHDIEKLLGGMFQQYVSVSKHEKIHFMEEESIRIGEDNEARKRRKQEISNGYLQFKPTAKMKSLEKLEHTIFFQDTFSRLKGIYLE